MPKVSVVIPLYNKEPHIARALNSVLSQTVQDFEVIVVDDGSTDGGAEVVRSFDDQRIRLIQQENQGVSAARNWGIEAAEAELIAFLDADDEWLPGFLETIQRMREKFANIGAYATAYMICEDNFEKRIAKYKGLPSAPWEGIIPNYFYSMVFGEPPICSSVVAIPKQVFLNIGLFSTESKMGEDLDMWFRIALKYPIAFSYNIGAIYHRESINRACNDISNFEKGSPIIETAQIALKEDITPLNKELILEYVAKLNIYYSIRLIRSGNRKTGRLILINCNTRLFLKRKLLWIILSFFPQSILDSL
ncbi:glycosyltransferase family 2 protein [Methanogenium sp. MK-MG]|uniref:glycosyltransferase family 2 protein n=1 Tax=Methanogenium sp. MK-MG TaxID=2599926 RepID=UPI0013EC7553|nr:glycosyltransferase family 2 protein [Methanogenium sp. MK-MG]KAF1079005.1 Undecaprenyl-phosphate 4-deoxy-4-formamido-L-arabinose transferase [Methanogenium sp. MK-MG]